ncbi:hypothetical protein JCM10908_003484 [Rhodotorula pacifica]|uniref:uncharacterized protein n=1 Tax=Rhodotorula pacifica TaxID=1495444 RepID=UPI003173B1A4
MADDPYAQPRVDAPPPAERAEYNRPDDRESYPPRGSSRPLAPPPRPRDAPVPQPSNVLGVFGLSIRTVDRDLHELFSAQGRRVEKALVVYDQRSGRSRGFGFVTMGSVGDAESAIAELNGINLHGRRIRVDFSATQRPHDPTPGEYRGPRRDDDLAPPRGGYPPVGGDRWASRGDPYRGGGGGGYGGGGYGGGGGRRGYDDPYGGDSYRAPLPSRGGDDRWGYGGGGSESRSSRRYEDDRRSSRRHDSRSRSRSRSRSPVRRSSTRDRDDRSRSPVGRAPPPPPRERSLSPKREY